MKLTDVMRTAAIRVAVLAGGLTLAIISVLSLMETTHGLNWYTEYIQFSADQPVLGIFVSSALAGTLYGLVHWLLGRVQDRRSCLRWLTFAACMWTAVVGVAWLWNGDFTPGGGDMERVYAAAVGWVENRDYSFLEKEYFRTYPFQVGLVLAESFFFRLFHTTNYHVIILINLICSVMCVYLNGRIAQLAFDDDEITAITMLFSAMFLPFPLVASLVYGDCLSWGLCWLSVFFALKGVRTKDGSLRWRYLMALPVLLLPASLIRGTSQLWCLAIVIVLGIHVLCGKFHLRDRVLVLLVVAAILISGFGSTKILNRYMEFRIGQSLEKGTPKIGWIVMGLSDSRKSCGGFDGWIEDVYIRQAGYDYDLANLKNKLELKRRVQRLLDDPEYAWSFYKRKLSAQWTDPTHQVLNGVFYLRCDDVEWDPEGQAESIGSPLMRTIMIGEGDAPFRAMLNRYQTMVYLTALAGVWALMKEKRDIMKLLPLVVFLAGWFFYLIWETRARYTLPFVMAVLPVAALGTVCVCRKVWIWIQTKQKKKEEIQVS